MMAEDDRIIIAKNNPPDQNTLPDNGTMWELVKTLQGTVLEMKGKREAYEDLKDTVELLKEDLAECQRELADMRRGLDYDDSSSAADRIGSKPITKTSGHATHNVKHNTSIEPITYSEAFERVGGTAAVEQYTEMSSAIQEKVNNPELGEELKQVMSSISAPDHKGYSTVLLNQRYVSELSLLYKDANRVYSDFDAALRDLAKLTNSVALVAPIKGEKRARMKAMFKYADSDGDGIAWYRLTDLVRATLVFPDIKSMYEAVHTIIDFFAKNGNYVKEYNDRYQRMLPGGYRDIQLVVQFNNHMCELQLNTDKMIQAKQTMGHRSFEVIRELKAAIEAGDLERVINALEFGRDNLGENTAIEMSNSGDTEESDSLKWLLRGKTGNSLIHEAAKNGHAEILHTLILYGSDVNSRDEAGNTPLHHAVFRGSERCVWAILDSSDPDLDAVNNDGETALVRGYLLLWTRPPESMVRAVTTLAQYAGVDRIKAAREVADKLIDQKVQNSRHLVQHSADGDVKSVHKLLTEFKSPDSVSNGMYAIEAAIEGSHDRVIELLLNFDVSLETREGRMPLIEKAIEVGDIEVIKMLQKAKAPITPSTFQKAIDDRNMEALKALITTSTTDLPLCDYEVWLDDSEELAPFVAQLAGLKRRIYRTVHSTSNYEYATVHTFHEDSGVCVLSVNTADYPHIAMAEDEVQDGRIYEFALNKLGTPSELRLRHSNLNVMTREVRQDADTVKEGEFRSFRFSFDPQILKIERYDSSGKWEPFMELDRQTHFQEIKFCRVAAYEFEADWRIPLSPLEEAIHCRDMSSVHALLESGVSLETENDRLPIMQQAIRVGDMDIVRALHAVDFPIDVRSFQEAVDKRNVEALQFLLGSYEMIPRDVEVWMEASDIDEAIVAAGGDIQFHMFAAYHTAAEYFYQTAQTFDNESGEVIFSVKSENYAHIALSEDEVQGGNIYELNLTQDGSSQLRVRSDLRSIFIQPPECTFYDQTIKTGEFRSFRLSFDPGEVRVERYDCNGTWELMTALNRPAYSPDQAIKFCRVTAHEHPADWRIRLHSSKFEK